MQVDPLPLAVGLLLGEHPQELRRRAVLGGQQRRLRADYVLQEVDCHVLQRRVALEILQEVQYNFMRSDTMYVS